MRFIGGIKCEFVISGTYVGWVSVFSRTLKGGHLKIDSKSCIKLV